MVEEEEVKCNGKSQIENVSSLRRRCTIRKTSGGIAVKKTPTKKESIFIKLNDPGSHVTALSTKKGLPVNF